MKVWFLRGDVLRQLERYEESLASYDRALELQPDYASGWGLRGDVLRQLERYKESLASYDRALKLKPDYIKVWFLRGTVLHQLKRYEESLASYDHALELQPDDTDIWMNKGYLLYELGKYEKALACLLQVSKFQPDDPAILNNQAFLMLVEHSYGSNPIFEKPLLIKRLTDCQGVRRLLLLEPSVCQKALTLFGKAIAIRPDFTLAWANKCFPEFCLGHFQIALEDCEKALILDPENSEGMNDVVHSNRGNILLQLEDLKLALQSFKTAIKLNPLLDEAWNGQGTALYLLGRYSEASKSFAQALELNHPLAERNLEITKQHL
jgi:superkiller protein 3